ncbi:hypothetical protein CSB37_03065 [bacterium DOLZORAL124_38_8]|nr:MAG: hypothetical protein CSB37_03065 [bacterium DOLZORAL124_38_8]
MKQQKLGTFIDQWTAYDHYPHYRKPLWYVWFCLLFFGIAALCIWVDPVRGWITALAFFVTAAFYFWTHRNGHETHEIKIYSEALVIQDKIIPFKDIAEYWFVYDVGVAVLNLEKRKKKAPKISLQMGDKTPDFFRAAFNKTALNENTEKKESLTDLWIRALKL